MGSLNPRRCLKYSSGPVNRVQCKKSVDRPGGCANEIWFLAGARHFPSVAQSLSHQSKVQGPKSGVFIHPSASAKATADKSAFRLHPSLESLGRPLRGLCGFGRSFSMG